MIELPIDQIICGDNIEVMRTLPDNSIDAIVTDPPYGLSKEPDMAEVLRHWLDGDDYTHKGNGFMGKSWDSFVPGPSTWRECLRVLKPGGHLLAFAGTRTQDLMSIAIRLAGFENRDCLMYVFGSGFPKSLDVGKAIDKCNGETGRFLKFTEWMRTTGLKSSEIDRITETNMGGHYLTAASQPAIPTAALWAKLRPHCGDVPAWVNELVDRIEAEREVVGKGASGTTAIWADGGMGAFNITAPATEAAKQWDGWGSALKPAYEPCLMFRKPLDGTIAGNVLKYGVGGINVDGCRVEAGEQLVRPPVLRSDNAVLGKGLGAGVQIEPAGRFPANLILSWPEDEYDADGKLLPNPGKDEVVGLFPESDGSKPGSFQRVKTSKGLPGGGYGQERSNMRDKTDLSKLGYDDNGGSAARFFYTAKADASERRNSKHPTVKPIALMRYLVRLVSPIGSIVLDPFAGSGTTLEAAKLESCRYIGIEISAEYVADCKERLSQGVLF